MLDRSTQFLIQKAQNGNAPDRDMLIEQYRPFILRAVSHICKRSISWEHDEASIGMIALNEAIDRYDGKQGKSFDNFAYMVIHNRLVDEFRRQGKVSEAEYTVLDAAGQAFDQTFSEVASSMEKYNREQTAWELAQELQLYDETLQLYGVSLEELEQCCPKHRDTRKQLIRMARSFSAHPDFVESLQRTRKLPVKKMLLIFDVSSKTIERNRKYLIALVLLFASPEFERIRSVVSFANIEE